MGALDGIRVLDLGTLITCPLAAMLLADLGADVIKIERPGSGDTMRLHSGDPYNGFLIAYNRNKRSVVVDLQQKDGQDVLARLIETADVLLENFRPGVLARLGFTAELLRELNPQLIHCSITGFGTDGPYKDRASMDAVAQGLSGLSSLFMDPVNPQVTGPTISDPLAGYYAAYGILGALFERERTGVARRVELNMLETTIGFMQDTFTNLTRSGRPQTPFSRAAASQAFVFRTSDDHLVVIHLSSQEKFWRGMLAALGAEELGQDQRFATYAVRFTNYLALRDAVVPYGAKQTRAELTAAFEAHGLGYAPVNTAEDVLDDPQVRHLGTFVDVEHPTIGPVKLVRRPVRFDGSRDDQPLRPPPMLGEHTQEVLAELKARS
jgi:crotonobetainyl-CoA:carnitine CoA-transferase CaiB-like acyl-CoA transferase